MAGNTGPGERRRSGRKWGDLVLPCMVSSLSLSLCCYWFWRKTSYLRHPQASLCLSQPTPFHLSPLALALCAIINNNFLILRREPDKMQARSESQEKRRRKPQEERTCACWEGPRCRQRGAWQASTPSNPGRDRGKVCAANGGNQGIKCAPRASLSSLNV